MRLVRIILAFALAVSLAMSPLGASAASFAVPADGMQDAMHMAGHDGMSMDECCPDMKGSPSQQDGDNCAMGFCCLGGALALGDVTPVAFRFATLAAEQLVLPADQIVFYRGGSPPFRPPRS